MFNVAPDNSVSDRKGRILLFSLQRFISDISQGDDCFICGAKRGSVPFNDEHILPDWILRHYKLHDKNIILPNGTEFRYGQFTISCCSECNSTMGSQFETPIAEVFAKGPQGVSQELKSNGPWRLFCWMALIFLKTHLKDQHLNFHRDRRKGEVKIGELHSWENLHHIHCVARSFYTGAELTIETIGSLLVLPAKVRSHFESFDYGDFSLGQTMLLRLDETAIIAVFNDSQAALSLYDKELTKIGGPLSPLQLREIAARLASINIQLTERPRFSSDIDLLREEYKIVAHRPNELRLDNWDDKILGSIMHHVCAPILTGSSDVQILENLKTGRYTFLVDEEGKFLKDHMELA